MNEKDFLSKILSEHSAPPTPSLSEQFADLLNVPKQPSLADQLRGVKNAAYPQNHTSTRQGFDDKEQRKEQIKEESKNPMYTLTSKNFSRLVDKADEHDSKIEMVCFKVADLEDNQARMQAEIVKINESLKDSGKNPPQNAYKIEWRSFAYGAIVLASLWFAIHRLT